MAVGDIYIPLQISGQDPIKDMDKIFYSKYGTYRMIVKDYRVVSQEFINKDNNEFTSKIATIETLSEAKD